MQIRTWVLAVCLAAAVTARPEGRPEGRSPTVEAVRVVESAAPNAIEEQPKAEAAAPKPLLPSDDLPAKPLDEAKKDAAKDAVKEEPAKEAEDAMKLPVPIEPDFGSPDDPKVFPEGALRSPNAAPAADAMRVPVEKPEVALVPTAVLEAAAPAQAEEKDKHEDKKAGRVARAYLPAEARGDDSDLERRQRATPRQLTDIHHLFLSHPDHAARLSSRLSPPKRVEEGRSDVRSQPSAARTARRARAWALPEVADNDLEQDVERYGAAEHVDDYDGEPTRFSLMRDEDVDVDEDASALPRTSEASPGSAPRVTVTTFIPTLTAISTTSVEGKTSRISWPLAGYFPVVIQDPLLGLYHAWASGGGLASVPGNIFEYGPAADVCSGGRAKRIRRDKDQGAEEAAEDDHAVDGVAQEQAEEEGSGDGAASRVEPVAVDAEGSGEDAVTVESGEQSLPTDQEDDDDESDKSPQDLLEKKLRKNKNKVDKRVHKVVAQVKGLARRVQARVADVLADSGALDGVPGDGGRDDAVPTLTRVVVRRGGVAVAGPGGIATAGFGGTAIVGPGGIAYTAPDSTAVAGPGARVVAVPSERLLDMFRAFREASELGVQGYRPAWLGSIPDDGKLVAVGPIVYRNPPEVRDESVRPAHWVFGNTRLLGLRRR